MLVAARLRPDTLFDDAAITFRYAAQLADGNGFTFNTGDRTSGASAPLYTLALAVAARLGVRPETAAGAASVPLFGAAVALATALAHRLGGWAAATVTAAFLLTSDVFQNQMLSGMESALAVTLGLAALLAISSGHATAAAALAGLAVVNRLDALALVAALAVAAVALRRRPPPRVLGVGAAVVAPWFLFATWYFGSPLPHSMTQKLDQQAGSWDQDPTWVLQAITGRHGTLVLVLAAGSTVLLVRRRHDLGVAGAVHLALVVWMAVHIAAYSIIDLGAPYPWYVTAAIPPMAIAGGLAFAAMLGRTLPAVGVAALLAISFWPGVRWTAQAVVDPPPERTTRLLDATRADAGRFVAERSVPDDVVRTCFGWVSYETIDLRVDEVCPLSTREPVPAPTWQVDSRVGEEELVPPEGFRRVARFTRTGPDGIEVASIVYRRD